MTGVRTWIGDEGLKTLACHQEGELSIIKGIVLDFKPELMVELGTLIGGVTLLLHQCFPDIPLHSFDNRSMAGCLKKAKGGFTAESIETFQREAFNDNVIFYVVSVFRKGKAIIEELLASNKRKLIYCDNGNKDVELNLFAKHLLVGDLLGAHDWGYEVGWEWEGIKETLASFEEHPTNKLLEEKKLTSRFFRKII